MSTEMNEEKLEKFEIERKVDFSQYRKNIQGWEFIKTAIWGNHRWDYYKLIPLKRNPFDLLKLYFDPKEITKKRKKLQEKFEILQQRPWLPLDKLYIKAQWGIIKHNPESIEKKNLNISNKEDREFFFEKNKLKPEDFITWVLFVMDWERINSIDDICERFWTLFPKFLSFSNTDMTPEMVKDKFNSKLKTLGEHTIRPIEVMDTKEYYDFIINPLVSSISTSMALEKLFFFVRESDFLKGLASGVNFKPSFSRYTAFLEEIFSGKYNNKYLDTSHLRRLNENEIRVYDDQKHISYVRQDHYIPNFIKEKYGISDWKIVKFKGEPLNSSELESYKKYMKKNLTINRLDMIDKVMGEIKKRHEKSTEIGKEKIKEINSKPHKKWPTSKNKEEAKEKIREILKKEKKI